jgi:hypothetical protein
MFDYICKAEYLQSHNFICPLNEAAHGKGRAWQMDV